MAEKVIKGQAWIFENEDQEKHLVQDETVMSTSGDSYNRVTDLLNGETIWENLKKDGIEVKSEADMKADAKTYFFTPKGYFFWIYEAEVIDEDRTVLVKLECPKPTNDFMEEIFGVDYNFSNITDEDLSRKSQYVVYWAKKFRDTAKTAESVSKIQPEGKTVFDPSRVETKFYVPSGEVGEDGKEKFISFPKTELQPTSLSEIQSLLLNLF